MKLGSKIYLAASIVIMLALAIACAHLNTANKEDTDRLNAELASATDANRAYAEEKTVLENKISDYEGQIDELNSTIEGNEETISSLRDDIDDYSSSSDYYAAYNGLIAFADANTGSSEKNFFASDTVLHMTTDEITVFVYVSDKTTVNCVIEDKDVASIEWVGWANDNVAILKVTPGEVIGSTRITLVKGDSETASDDEGDDEDASSSAADLREKIEIFVYND